MSQLSYREASSTQHERVEKRLLSVADVCVATSFKETFVKKLIREQRLRSLKVDGRRVVPASEVDAFIEQLKAEQWEDV